MPSVLGPQIQDDLGISPELVFAGITVMFALGAVCSPRIGRIVDRIGARSLMATGSLVYALSLVGAPVSQGPVSYLACWAVMGVASAMALSTPSSIAMVQVAGPRARQAIALLTIIGGFASSVFWPITGVLDAAIGWREMLLIYAAIHLLACAPIHWLILPRRPPVPVRLRAPPRRHRRRGARRGSPRLPAAVDQPVVRRLRLHRRAGPDDRDAARARPFARLGAAARLADRPGQVGIRIFELMFGHRYSIMRSAVFGSVMLPVGLGLALRRATASSSRWSSSWPTACRTG